MREREHGCKCFHECRDVAFALRMGVVDAVVVVFGSAAVVFGGAVVLVFGVVGVVVGGLRTVGALSYGPVGASCYYNSSTSIMLFSLSFFIFFIFFLLLSLLIL